MLAPTMPVPITTTFTSLSLALRYRPGTSYHSIWLLDKALGGLCHDHPSRGRAEESQPERSLVLRRAIKTEAHSRALSVTWVSIAGHHDRVVNHESDRVYYVIEGTGRFQVGDGAPVEGVAADDFILSPAARPMSSRAKCATRHERPCISGRL